VERTWGAFSRMIRMPGPVDSEKTTAAFKDGVLTVTLPKTAAAKGNVIPVKAG
jgi:HSP20 family protein